MPSTLWAADWTAGNLVFSDELGGFNLLSVSGTGTITDPIVVVEEMTDIGRAALIIRGSKDPQHRVIPITGRAFAIIKIVINRSRRVWAGFDLELREVLDTPSPHHDGLSFDQSGSFGGNPFRSDSFTISHRVAEPYDWVRFRSGSVDPGAAVRFNFYITDPTPVPEFYLLQEPRLLIARDRPSTERLAVAAAQ